MSGRSRQPLGSDESYGHSSIPAPTSITISDFQGPVQHDIIETTEQWIYDDGYIDPNFGYMPQLPGGNLGTVGGQYESDTSRASRDPNSLERSSVTEDSLLDLLDGSHTLDKPATQFQTANPKQLPEALKYLAPVPNRQSGVSHQPTPHEILPLRNSPQESHHTHQYVSNAQLVYCLPGGKAQANIHGDQSLISHLEHVPLLLRM